MFQKKKHSKQQCLTNLLSNFAFGLLLAIYGGGKLVGGAAKDHVGEFCLVVGAVFLVLGVVWLIRWLKSSE